MSIEYAMLASLLVPLAGTGLIVYFGFSPNLRESMTLLTAGTLFTLVCIIAGPVIDGARPELVLATPLPGLELRLQAEPLGILFALVASFLWIVTSVYAIGYMRGHHEKNQTRFYAFFAIALSATMGVAFSANLLTLFLFYEILTLSTYPLVTHAGTENARNGGRTYLGILLFTSISFLLLAIVGTWHVAGTLDFRPGGILDGQASPTVLGILLALFVFGIGKAAMMPFHRWLPAAMVAPTPVSALLHAVAVVKAGVFAVLKICVYVFGLDLLDTLATTDLLLYLAAASILIASLVAMTRDNLKARLAYSTVSQLGYIVVGGLLASSIGLVGGAMHIAMHAFGKITLFFCAGAIMVVSHKKLVSELDGLGRAMPITFAAFMIGTLSIIGLPLFGGMWSKWYLALGAMETSQLLVLAVLMASSLLNIMYLLPIPVRAFFSKPGGDDHYTEIAEAPKPMLLAMIITSGACVILFFYPEPLHSLAALISTAPVDPAP